MHIKICIGKDIHKLLNKPATIEELKQSIFKILPDRSNEIPLIQFTEKSGGTKVIATQEDYSSLLSSQQGSIKFNVEFLKEIKMAESSSDLHNLVRTESVEVPQENLYAKFNSGPEKRPAQNSSEPDKNIKNDDRKSYGPPEEEKGYESSSSSEGGHKHDFHHHIYHQMRGDKDDGYRAMKRMKNKAERDEKKKLREMRKIQLMKEIFTGVLFDNMAAIATCVGDYVTKGEEITEKANKMRPASKMAEIDNMMQSSRMARELEDSQIADKDSGASNPYYKKLCSTIHEKMQDLPQDDRAKANELLGGVPEKIFKAIENSNKAKLEKKGERMKKCEQIAQSIQMTQSVVEQSDSSSVKQKDNSWRRAEPMNSDDKKAYKEEKDRHKLEKEKYKEEKIKDKERERVEKDKEKDKEREKKKTDKKKFNDKEEDKDLEASYQGQKTKEKKEKNFEKAPKPQNQIEDKASFEKKKNRPQQPKKELVMSLQFIKEGNTSPSRVLIETKTFYMNISIKNNGEADWPKTSYLYPINPQVGKIAILNQVEPGKEISTVIFLNNPGKPGKYTTEWALAYKNLEGETVNVGVPFSVSATIEDPSPPLVKKSPEVWKPEEVNTSDLKSLVTKMLEEFPNTSLDIIVVFVKQNPGMTIDVLVQKFKTEVEKAEKPVS